MTTIADLSDDALNAAAKRAAQCERTATADLLRLLIEVERRGLHLALGHSSMFMYCTRVLLLAEQAAYSRITAARAARRFPQLLELLTDGALTLSSIGLLAPHLSDETVEPLIEAAASKSTREVERLIAAAFPQPDLPAQVRVLPQKRDIERAQFEDGHDDSLFANPSSDSPGETVSAVGRQSDSPQSSPSPVASLRSVIAPLAPSRYLLKVTLSEETHARLEQARSRCPVR